jgi:hypothetical protein
VWTTGTILTQSPNADNRNKQRLSGHAESFTLTTERKAASTAENAKNAKNAEKLYS